MLHEIFLSLSGVRSPLWSHVKDISHDGTESANEYISPPEQAMLAEVVRLSRLHLQVRDFTTSIQESHPSPLCRAVSARIFIKHLGAFRRKITDVEASILRHDAQYVGAYNQVPLSTIVTSFRPWLRPMEWLHQITKTLVGHDSRSTARPVTGPSLMVMLEAATHTGFTQLEDMAVDLLTTAQSAWMRLASSWMLYGQIPALGGRDFMIQEARPGSTQEAHTLKVALVPYFMTEMCASNMLSIGNALIQIRTQQSAIGNGSNVDVARKLLPMHVKHIKDLSYPLNQVLLENVVNIINTSISQNALASLLPLDEVLDLLEMTKEYLLLGRGEFAVALISNADVRFSSGAASQAHSQNPVRKLGKPELLHVNDAELDTILAKTWADLVTLQGRLETEDASLIRAKNFLRLSSFSPPDGVEREAFISTLTPVPSVIRIDIPSKSPFNIMITSADVAKYAQISSHLLSLRRGEVHLSSLWKLTGHRRCHPAPLGPPMSTTSYGKQALTRRRKREDQRALRTRRSWSTMSSVRFLLHEFGAYIQGEVIQNSWDQLRTWLQSGSSSSSSRPGISEAISDDNPGNGVHLTATAAENNESPTKVIHERTKDPRSVARAHEAYLNSLYAALLVDQDSFCQTLNRLLVKIDHVVALFERLQSTWQGLDLQEDDGIMDAYVNYAQDEKDILAEMSRSREAIETDLKQIVHELKTIEKKREVGDIARGVLTTGLSSVSSSDDAAAFVPWRARTLDRLIMKLDFLHGSEINEEEEQGQLVERFEDAME